MRKQSLQIQYRKLALSRLGSFNKYGWSPLPTTLHVFMSAAVHMNSFDEVYNSDHFSNFQCHFHKLKCLIGKLEDLYKFTMNQNM